MHSGLRLGTSYVWHLPNFGWDNNFFLSVIAFVVDLSEPGHLKRDEKNPDMEAICQILEPMYIYLSNSRMPGVFSLGKVACSLPLPIRRHPGLKQIRLVKRLLFVALYTRLITENYIRFWRTSVFTLPTMCLKTILKQDSVS